LPAKVKGGGKDALAMQLGFATSGSASGTPPDLTVTFGPTYTLAVPSSAFAPNGSRFTATVGGARVTLDYAREPLTVQAKGVDLGAFADGAQAVQIGAPLRY
jgi:hypothetical protein